MTKNVNQTSIIPKNNSDFVRTANIFRDIGAPAELSAEIRIQPASAANRTRNHSSTDITVHFITIKRVVLDWPATVSRHK